MKVSIIIPTCRSLYEIAPLMCNMEGFAGDCEIIATCKKVSAAANRNAGLEAATGDIIVMMDDDIAGFYDGWWEELIKPLSDPTVYMVSARLLDTRGNLGAMMFGGDPAVDICEVPRVPTACIAFRKTDIRFDENFIGSGFEDDDFCAKMAERFPDGRVVINNRCKVIHINEQKNQGGTYYDQNKKYFESIWRTEGLRRVRIQPPENKFAEIFNKAGKEILEAVPKIYKDKPCSPSVIPKIIHFVWIGSTLPAWAERNIAEFKILNPDYQIMLHDEKALSPRFRDHWNLIDHPEHSLAIKSDLLRLSALMEHGGWYFDTDFWPLVPIDEMVAKVAPKSDELVLFASKDRNICANGVLGCTRTSPGLKEIVSNVLLRKTAPQWWDYGTMCTFKSVKAHPEYFAIGDLGLVIPFTGKKAALECMISVDRIKKVKNAGAFAIHFEMKSSTDLGENLTGIDPQETPPIQKAEETPCITQSSDKTAGSTKKSSRKKKAESSLSVEPSTAS